VDQDGVAFEPHVGDGIFATVAAAIWNEWVSRMRLVESWLAYRRRTRTGKTFSDLDRIRPPARDYSGALLEMTTGSRMMGLVGIAIRLREKGACLSPMTGPFYHQRNGVA
jgi:hypothetical protein